MKRDIAKKLNRLHKGRIALISLPGDEHHGLYGVIVSEFRENGKWLVLPHLPDHENGAGYAKEPKPYLPENLQTVSVQAEKELTEFMLEHPRTVKENEHGLVESTA